MSWVIRFFLFFLVFWIFSNLLRSVLKRILGPLSTGTTSRSRMRANPTGAAIAGKMVKDPQCRMYVAENLAVEAQVEGATVYFCSDKCHNDYTSELKNRPRSDQQPA